MNEQINELKSIAVELKRLENNRLTLKQNLLSSSNKKESIKEHMSNIENVARPLIWESKEFKNETMRAVALKDVLDTNEGYQDLKLELDKTSVNLDNITIDLRSNLYAINNQKRLYDIQMLICNLKE